MSKLAYIQFPVQTGDLDQEEFHGRVRKLISEGERKFPHAYNGSRSVERGVEQRVAREMREENA